MTLHATREGEKVTIHGNIHLDVKVTDGRVFEFAVTEDARHVKGLWGQLGNLLHTPQDRARDGYERYREHAGGVSKFTGDVLPSFDDVDEDVRAHWIAAFTE
jgi:hypothetical protein